MKIGTHIGIFAVLTLTMLIVLFGFVRVSTPVLAPAAPLGNPERGGDGVGERLAQETPGVLEVPPGGKPIQDLGLLRIELDSIHVLEEGKVAVFLSFINKTKENLYLSVASPPEQKTFAMDDQGNLYRYESISGMGLDRKDALLCPAGGKATTSLLLSASGKKSQRGWLFSVASDLVLDDDNTLKEYVGVIEKYKTYSESDRQKHLLPLKPKGHVNVSF